MISIEAVTIRYGAALERVASSYEADSVLREDLLQEMLFAIYRALPTLREQGSLAAFVFRIAHNRGVAHVVRQTSRKRAESVALEGASLVADETPEGEIARRDSHRHLLAAIGRLPLPYRQVMTLVLEELTYLEIAEALDISVPNVGVRVNRAKAKLREILGHE